MDRKFCVGCEDNFYNGFNNIGVKECWHLKDAKQEFYKLIPVDMRPPYTMLEHQKLPTCYRKKRYVKVKPAALIADGYWK